MTGDNGEGCLSDDLRYNRIFVDHTMGSSVLEYSDGIADRGEGRLSMRKNGGKPLVLKSAAVSAEAAASVMRHLQEARREAAAMIASALADVASEMVESTSPTARQKRRKAPRSRL